MSTKSPFVRLLLWLACIAVFTLMAMGIWLVACHGSQSTGSLKWLQFLQTLGTFTIPPILCAWLWSTDHKPFGWLKMNKRFSWQTAVLAVSVMICAIPAINLLADLNSRLVLPEALASLEQFMKQQEEAASLLTERFLQADNIGGLLINIGLMALLPALAEELSFRGTLQQILPGKHLAIWLSALIFSAIHLQFYGFVPRMLMGAMFGYVFVWTESLWAPILMHFTNNAIAVIAYYLTDDATQGMAEKSWADTIGAGSTWWVGLCSLALVGVLLGITYRGQQEYVRRTRKE